MDQTTTVKVSFGEFTIKNILTIGQESQIAVMRSTISNGMYGQMAESPNTPEMVSAWRLYKLTELDGRIEKSPENWKGCAELTKEQLDELWKVWADRSGMFPAEPSSTSGENQEGGGGTKGSDSDS